MSYRLLFLVFVINIIAVHPVVGRSVAINYGSSIPEINYDLVYPNQGLYQNNYPSPNPYMNRGLYSNVYPSYQNYYPKFYTQRSKPILWQNPQTREMILLPPDVQIINTNTNYRLPPQDTKFRKPKVFIDQQPDQFPEQKFDQDPFFSQLEKKPTWMYDPETGETIPIHPDEEQQRNKEKDHRISRKPKIPKYIPPLE